MIKSGILFLLFLVPSLLLAQKARISFERQTHDFGVIHEKGGKVSCVFKFTNEGKYPLIVRHVEVSCGCTVPKWEKKPIPPGGSGAITITYNPKGRPGSFSKKIVVYTNASPPNHVLKVSGKVLSEESDIKTVYPFAIGELRFSSDTIRLKLKGTTQQIINMYYTGKKKLTITSILKPDYLQVDYSPLQFSNGEQGNLVLLFHRQSADQFKPTDRLLLETDEGKQGSFVILLESL